MEDVPPDAPQQLQPAALGEALQGLQLACVALLLTHPPLSQHPLQHPLLHAGQKARPLLDQHHPEH